MKIKKFVYNKNNRIIFKLRKNQFNLRTSHAQVSLLTEKKM